MTSSPWAPEKVKADAELRFEFREQAIDYMGELMRLHMFHRARKVPVAEKEKKKKKDETDDEEKDSKKSKKGKSDLRCIMTKCSWMEMTPMFGCMTPPLGIIAVCLFPLWPMEMRQGVYYLSVAAAGFLVFIIVLAIIKYILFVILFILTA